jgi:hypothetical protein
MAPEKKERRTAIPLDPTLQDPDDIMRRSLPQVGEDEAYATRSYKILRFTGPTEEVKHLIFKKPDGKTLWKQVEQTKFVQIIEQDGTVHMQRYDKEKHDEWDAIPEIQGMTPGEFVALLEGLGDEETPHNQQFNNERKKPGGARKKSWPFRQHPKPKKLR